MKKGDIVRITIEKLAPDGSGKAEVDGRVVSVRGALPGDEVEVRVQALKRHSARVRLESFIAHGVERTRAACPHFPRCGGCRWQDVPYEVQCTLKTELVRETLNGIPGIEPLKRLSFVPSPDIMYYRNKMEFSFDCRPGTDDLKLGLHEFGRYDRVFTVTACRLESPVSNRVVTATRDFAVKHGLTTYGLKSHIGLLRFLVVREGKNTGDVMVNLVTSGETFDLRDEYCRVLLGEVPEVSTIVWSINRSTGSVAVGEERAVLYGEGSIREKIGQYTYLISPDSFFQTNPHQCENLYRTIADFSNLSGGEHLLDLYCGTGSIGIYLAGRAGRVTGIEVVEDAVRDARKNAEINGIENILFIAGKAEKTIHESMDGFDVVVCDPPRAGIHPKVLHQLVRMRIPRMVYVSCNIKAMPNDLEMLLMAGYRITNAAVFDMSPHTPHIETVLLLELP